MKKNMKNTKRNIKNTLKKLQNKFNVYLSGGDTTVSSKLVFTIMTIGNFKKKPILRSGAKINDDIYVSGNLGDSYIGLKILSKKANYKNFNNFFIYPRSFCLIWN